MTYQILKGNSLDLLPTLADNSIDAIVTDPPYELGFMGKTWDNSGIAYSLELWQQCLRVLKPGGHLLAFSGSRTYHRMVVSIEDAGFEIRDMISWISNKTFPKSLNIGKAIDKIADANTNKWQGWGTGLKPTVEPIVMARKPVEGTVANNVLTYGTGGLNIDASRIAASDQEQLSKFWDRNQSESKDGAVGYVAQKNIDLRDYKPVDGRWPANLILDEQAAELVDKQSGDVRLAVGPKVKIGSFDFKPGQESKGSKMIQGKEVKGGASRFFYVARASKPDRNEGLEDANNHPTVKPTELMRYLVKLITPPGGTVLDPFTGSGSTGKAAILEGFDFIGIELTEDYWPIIEGRLKHAEAKVAEAKENIEAQPQGLF